MLHDLLYALRGHTGNIFKEMRNGDVKIVSGLPFISPQEETSINRLLHLSSCIVEFKKFMNCYGSTLQSFDENSLLQNGCYLQAFCYGLGDVLKSYDKTILELEKEVLSDAYLTHVHMQQALEKFHTLFDVIREVLNTIKVRKCHGCQILSVLHRAYQSGDSLVEEAMINIFHKCMVVMYRQLSTWLLHGILFDTYNEFYIAQNTETAVDAVFKTESRNAKTVTDSFYIRTEMLPSFLPPRSANVILFIGSSLHLFEKNKSFVVKERSILPEILSETTLQRNDGVLHQHEEDFMREFAVLQAERIFCAENFEACLDRVRSAVAEELWDLCVVKAQLVSQLMMLKDFYLLGLGELFLTFLDEAQNVLSKPITKTTEHDVNQAFIRSAIKVQIEEDGVMKQFRITVSRSDSQNKQFTHDAISELQTNDPWTKLGMTFNVSWPLHIIFTPTMLGKYDKLFKFLLRVRRTQQALLVVWRLFMRKKQPMSDPASFTSNLMLRNHMSHLVNSLQYYVQADVLESHFSTLLDKIKNPSSRDFEQIVYAHNQYLTALLAQCFILSTPVFKSLVSVLDVCQKFCSIITTSMTSLTRMSKSETNQTIADIAQEFKRQSVLLFHTLSGVCNQQSNPHLAQFLLLLDYNKYYTIHNTLAM